MGKFLLMKLLLKKLIQFRFLLNIKHFSTTLVLTILLTYLQIPAWAADEDLDTSFGGGDGIVTTLLAGTEVNSVRKLLLKLPYSTHVKYSDSMNGTAN